MQQFCGDKASGSDGMMMAFLKDSWDTLKVDILRMSMELHCTGKFVKSVNATFISLIRKKPLDINNIDQSA